MTEVPGDIAECFERNGWGIWEIYGQTIIFLTRDLGDRIGNEELYKMCIKVWTEEKLRDFGFREMTHGLEKDFYKYDIVYTIEVPPSRRIVDGKPTPDDMLAEIFVYRIKNYEK